MGFVDLAEQLLAGDAKGLARLQFGDQIVVVGIEILGHLAGGGRRAGRRPPAGHAERGIEIDRARDIAEARRHGADQRRDVEHLIVEGEVADRDEIQPGVALRLPVPGAQLGASGLKRCLVALALPIGFDGFLQLAPSAYAGVAQSMCQRHRCFLGCC